jgi:hypothetical protein
MRLISVRVVGRLLIRFVSASASASRSAPVSPHRNQPSRFNPVLLL